MTWKDKQDLSLRSYCKSQEMKLKSNWKSQYECRLTLFALKFVGIIIYTHLVAARIRNYKAEKIIHFYDSWYESYFVKRGHFYWKDHRALGERISLTVEVAGEDAAGHYGKWGSGQGQGHPGGREGQWGVSSWFSAVVEDSWEIMSMWKPSVSPVMVDTVHLMRLESPKGQTNEGVPRKRWLSWEGLPPCGQHHSVVADHGIKSGENFVQHSLSFGDWQDMCLKLHLAWLFLCKRVSFSSDLTHTISSLSYFHQVFRHS